MKKATAGRAPRFADKVVIVTGAAQGIGRGVAESIAAEGGTVFAVDRSPIVHEVVDAISAAGGQAAAQIPGIYRAFLAQLDRLVVAIDQLRTA